MSLERVHLTRRVFLAAVSTAALAGCAPPAPSPTAPPKPAEAKPAAPTAASTQPAPAATPAAAAKPTAAPPKPAVQAPPKPKTMIKWKHLEPNALLESAFRGMALAKGFYKEYNLDVEINFVSAGGNAIIAALTAGEADSGEMGPAPVLASAPKGGTSKLIGAFMPGNIYAIWGPKSANRLEDLKGMTIGTSAPGALTNEVFSAVVDARGMSLKDFTMRSISGSAAVGQALIAGTIDGGVSGVEFQKEFEGTGRLHAVVWAYEIIPKYVRFSIAASEKTMREKSDPLQWFLIAHTRGHRYALDHRDETLALASKLTGREQQENRWVVDWYIDKKIVNPNVEVTPEQVNYMLDLYVKIGTIPEKVPIERVYEGKYAKTAIEVLGPYQPGKTS